ncbi:MAG: energy transducer TonB [Paludibacteraceae bacterium]|nr:energy transducer TonB [Paludibacteraceae bacterium]
MQIKKSQQASLEDKKLTYALMGFVFVLSVCFVALEWTKPVKKFDTQEIDVWTDEDMDIVQTQQQETPPPPPQPEPEVSPEELIVVDDSKEVAEVNVQTEDNNEAVEIKAPIAVIEEPEEDENVVFVVVEKMPEFPGGNEALRKYLAENLRYPSMAAENGITGRAVCQFVVNKDGAIVDVQVVRSSGDDSLDREAIRVIKAMPKWNPGQQRGKAVRVKYTVPVNFRLG